MEVKNPQRRVLRMKCSTKSVETTKAAVEEKVEPEQATNASVADAPQHVDMFMDYHEDAENYRHQPENFETVYSILDQYANEDENPENMDVQDLFVRMPLEKQELVMDLINPDNWKASGRQRHPLNSPEDLRSSRKAREVNRTLKTGSDTPASRQLVKNVVTGETAIYVPDSAQPELPAGWVPMNSAKQMTKEDIIKASTSTLKRKLKDAEKNDPELAKKITAELNSRGVYPKGKGSKKVGTDASLEGESMYDNPTIQREALNSALKPDQEHRVIGIAKVYDHYYGSMDERQIEDFFRRKMETYAPDAHVYIYHVGPGQLEITIEADNPKDLRNAKFAINQSKAIESVKWQKPTNAGCHGKRATDASVSGEKVYRVWYEPYGYQGEEDFMDVHARSEEEARHFVSSSGWVSEVEEIDESRVLDSDRKSDSLNSGYREFDHFSVQVQADYEDREEALASLEDLADIFYEDANLEDYFEGPHPGTLEPQLFESGSGYSILFAFYAVTDSDMEDLLVEIQEKVNAIEGLSIVDVLSEGFENASRSIDAGCHGKKKELNASLPEDTLSFTVAMPTTDRAWAEEMFEDIADFFYYDDYLSAFFLGPKPGTVDTYLTTWSNGCTVTFEFSSLVGANRDEIEARVNDILSNYNVNITDTNMY